MLVLGSRLNDDIIRVILKIRSIKQCAANQISMLHQYALAAKNYNALSFAIVVVVAASVAVVVVIFAKTKYACFMFRKTDANEVVYYNVASGNMSGKLYILL